MMDEYVVEKVVSLYEKFREEGFDEPLISMQNRVDKVRPGLSEIIQIIPDGFPSGVGLAVLVNGLMVLKDYSGPAPVILRKMTQVPQMLDLVRCIQARRLHVHITGE